MRTFIVIIIIIIIIIIIVIIIINIIIIIIIAVDRTGNAIMSRNATELAHPISSCCRCAVLRRAHVNVLHDVRTGQPEPVFVVTQFARNVALA
jgi:hypothetical protein